MEVMSNGSHRDSKISVHVSQSLVRAELPGLLEEQEGGLRGAQVRVSALSQT